MQSTKREVFLFLLCFCFRTIVKIRGKKLDGTKKLLSSALLRQRFFTFLNFLAQSQLYANVMFLWSFSFKKKFILCLPPIMCKKCLIPPKLLMYSKIKAEINFHKETMSPDFLSLFFFIKTLCLVIHLYLIFESKHSIW